MHRIPADVRYAVRALRRTPVFTLVAVLSLALALAVNTTMFAMADAVLHPHVPYPQAERLFRGYISGGDRERPVTVDERFRMMRDAAAPEASTAAYSMVFTNVQVGLRSESFVVNSVTPEFFPVLGVPPEAGRVLGAADDAGESMVVVVSHRFWARVFGERPLTPGVRVNVGAATYTIIGIMPRGFHGATGDLWIPMATTPSVGARRVGGPFPLFRLRPGATRAMLTARLDMAARQLTAAYASRDPRLYGFSARVLAFVGGYGQGRMDAYSTMAYRPVLLVLLIACANLATMMLARGLARRRELAMRMALGASRWAVIRLVFVECGVIAATGAILGAVVTAWGFRFAVHYVTPFVPALGDVEPLPSWRVFAFMLALAGVVLLLAGIIPAVWAASTDPAEPIKEGAGTTTGRRKDRYNPLIVVEVALSTALLMSAALLTISAARLAMFDFQYAAKRLLVATVGTEKMTFASPTTSDRLYEGLVTRAARLPGAAAAAWRRGEMPKGRVVTSEEGRSGQRWINLEGYTVVSPGYLWTVGIPVVHGRDFEPGDRAGANGAVIVDERAARALWPDVSSPVGHMLKLGDTRGNAPWLRVVGVARTTELEPRQDPDLPPPPVIYVVRGGDSSRSRDLVVRGVDGSDATRATLALSVRRELQSIGPDAGSAWVRPWLWRFDDMLALNSFMTMLFTAFGAFALALCGVGFYGVLAYSVSRRVREFAVRVALGAPRGKLVAHVIHDAAVMVLAGIGIGAFLGLYAAWQLGALLYTLRYADVVALVSAEVLLLGVAIVGSLGPVRQALRVDPVEMLRAT